MSERGTMTTTIASDADARQALEAAADELFYRDGVHAVSMAQIRDRSGVSFRRLYSICPSKSDLISLWLRHRHTEWTTGFSTAVDARIADGRPPVDAVFEALAAWVTETDFRGCGFINTHAECGELTDDHRSIIEEHKRGLASYLQTLLGETGDMLAVLFDGAIVQASIFKSDEPIHHAQRAASALLNAND